MTKTSILIITGGFHSPKSYTKLSNALRTAGYDVHVPSLPSANQVRPPNCDLYSDTKHIRTCAEDLIRDGRTVVALAHSYGGLVCSNALYGLGVEARSAEGLQGGVSHLIFMAAYAEPEGTSMVDTLAKFGHADLLPFIFELSLDGTAIPRNSIAFVAPHNDGNEAEAYLKTMVRWNSMAMHQPIEHAAWREIPPVFIYATSDLIFSMDYQRSWVANMEKAGRKVRTFELNSGHAPNLTATDDVVDIVNKVVSG